MTSFARLQMRTYPLIIIPINHLLRSCMWLCVVHLFIISLSSGLFPKSCGFTFHMIHSLCGRTLSIFYVIVCTPGTG